MPDQPPTASPDRAERRERDRGYRKQQWEGVDQYVCTQHPCWLGTYSRVSSFDEADMQQHQAMAHG